MLMGGRIRLWIIAASVAGLIALAVVSWLSYRNTKELIAANGRLAQAHKLIEDLTALHLLLDDAESSCRGYALSGKDEYLKPYDVALAQLDITRQVLGHDLGDDPNRSRQFQELEPIIQARLEVMKGLVDARRKGGFEAAVRVVQSGPGKRLADEIRQRISVIQTEERNDLLDRERESRERARSTILAVGLTCLLGIALLLAASIVIYRLNRQGEKDHLALQNAERIQRTILNSAAYSMISTDPDGSIQMANAAAEDWLRYKGAELVGSNVTIVHDAREL
jgi:CHASE3 domain sensor protein